MILHSTTLFKKSVHPPAAIAKEDAVGVAGAGGVRVDHELFSAPPRARHRRQALR